MSFSPCFAVLFHFVIVLSSLGRLSGQMTEPEPLSSYVYPRWMAGSLPAPIGIENAGDGSGRLFIVGKSGTVRICKDGEIAPEFFLDIRERVRTSGERGLLGIAFPPDHETEKCFYALYSTLEGGSVLSRFRLTENPDVADPASEELIMSFPGFGRLHNGGQIAFGPDGLLYIALGDGEERGNSQNPESLMGKILRIDVSHSTPELPYAIPPTNPGVADPEMRDEILFWGLRNPWRFSFDSLTGDLFIADVGEYAREEINFVPAAEINAGANFGWPMKEGTTGHAYPDTELLRDPVFEYDRSVGECVTGGFFYRGPATRFQGLYIFGDFSNGKIWGLSPGSGEVVPLADIEGSISSFGRDEAGNIYFLDYYGGTLYQMEAPEILPAPGFVYWDRVVQDEAIGIFAPLPRSVIRYTTDGSEPDGNSPVYDDMTGVRISQPTRVRARAYLPGMDPSPVSEKIFQCMSKEVTFDPPQQYENYHDDLVLRMNCDTEAVDIHYTLDGTEPTPASPKYDPSHPPVLKKSSRVKAISVRNEADWFPSAVSSSYYTLIVAPVRWLSARHEMWAVRYDLEEPAVLASETPGAVIHYTLDGRPATADSPVWNNRIHIPEGVIVNTYATKGEMEPSIGSMVVVRNATSHAVFQRISGAPEAARDITRTPDGGLYVVEPTAIHQIIGGSVVFVTFNNTPYMFTATTDGKLALGYPGVSWITKRVGPGFSQDSLHYVPDSIRDLTAEPGGGLLYVTYTTQVLYRMDATGNSTRLAGTGARGGMNGPALQATFDDLSGVARDPSGRIFVSEKNTHRIRQISPAGIVTTHAGTGVAGWKDGPAATARFDSPQSIISDVLGNLYVVEGSGGLRIRKISPDGWVSTLRGPIVNATGSVQHSDGLQSARPYRLDSGPDGTLYCLADNSVFKITQEDWDNDGIADETEKLLGAPFVVGVDDRAADADADGFSNVAEWTAATHPSLAGSKPAGQSIRLGDGFISLCFPATPGTTRQLEFSDDMVTWTRSGMPVVGTLRSHSVRSPAYPTAPSRFYRLVETP